MPLRPSGEQIVDDRSDRRQVYPGPGGGQVVRPGPVGRQIVQWWAGVYRRQRTISLLLFLDPHGLLEPDVIDNGQDLLLCPDILRRLLVQLVVVGRAQSYNKKENRNQAGCKMTCTVLQQEGK